MGGLKSPGKSFEISKLGVWEAYRKVWANRGAPGRCAPVRGIQEAAPAGLFLDIAREGIEGPHGPQGSVANNTRWCRGWSEPARFTSGILSGAPCPGVDRMSEIRQLP